MVEIVWKLNMKFSSSGCVAPWSKHENSRIMVNRVKHRVLINGQTTVSEHLVFLVTANGTPSRGVEKQTAEDKIDFCGNVPSVC